MWMSPGNYQQAKRQIGWTDMLCEAGEGTCAESQRKLHTIIVALLFGQHFFDVCVTNTADFT